MGLTLAPALEKCNVVLLSFLSLLSCPFFLVPSFLPLLSCPFFFISAFHDCFWGLDPGLLRRCESRLDPASWCGWWLRPWAAWEHELVWQAQRACVYPGHGETHGSSLALKEVSLQRVWNLMIMFPHKMNKVWLDQLRSRGVSWDYQQWKLNMVSSQSRASSK